MWQGRMSSTQEKKAAFSRALVRLWGPVSEGHSSVGVVGARVEVGGSLPC